MRLACPYCGPRDLREFSILGDASGTRPDAATPDAPRTFHDYAYLRDNPAGEAREFWYHANGCRRWLVVTRDTRTHAISSVVFAATEATS